VAPQNFRHGSAGKTAGTTNEELRAMNTSVDSKSNFHNAPEDARSKRRTPQVLVVITSVALGIALLLGAWLTGTTGSTHVSAATPAEESSPVPYFPSQYLNQAGEPMPAPPTF
jgi:hypothetical protein